ncbi:MAG: sugar transferase [Marinilabiliaceae bacterium]|nr:sugar transferase [Marinilabiliaceae bacterium]
MIKEKERGINNLLAFINAIIACLSFVLSLYWKIETWKVIDNKDVFILSIFILPIWFILSKSFGLGQLYRSRPYSILMFNVLALSIFGSILLGVIIYTLGFFYVSYQTLIVFSVIDFIITFSGLVLLYIVMKYIRKRGLNFLRVIIYGDESAIKIINQLLERKEWGYRIVAIIDNGGLKEHYEKDITVWAPKTTDINSVLEGKTIDEFIYCVERPSMEEIESLIYSCNEVGVVFRMYSPFFNMLANRMHLHYFSTTPLLTFSNTPQEYWSMKFKQIFDVLTSLFFITILSPVFVFIALSIKITSKGPVFFKQKRVGLRGRKFWVYKFRTMVINAEALKADLHQHNEMDGPVFKITDDPRITKVGKFLRKTSLDELPQFFNVFLGNMSIVGPRPPIPEEVKDYERWQLRRLSMKPGITCIWQISPSRNDISFENWMKMDLEYIDNWSLKLDFVIILKTIRTMLRADGK